MNRTYTREFKQDALNYVETHRDSMDLHKIADNLGVPYHTLYGWIKDKRRIEREAAAKESSTTPKTLEEMERENERLRRELRDSQDALAILKKAISILND